MLFSQFLQLGSSGCDGGSSGVGNIPENLAALIYDKYINCLFGRPLDYYRHGQHSILVFLGKDLNITDSSLYAAVLSGNVDTVRFLTERNATIPYRCIPYTLMNYYNEIIELMLEYNVIIPSSPIKMVELPNYNGTIAYVQQHPFILEYR